MMRTGRLRRWLWIGAITGVLLVAVLSNQLPAIGAGALLYPFRRQLTALTPSACAATTFTGNGVQLDGWRCGAVGTPRATVIYLHGVADNRGSGIGVVDRYTAKGFDVIAYDSRAHGRSAGEVCTYGVFERDDLRRVIDTVQHQPIVVIGHSLGAAVALQTAAVDDRIAAVVAAETFSDLRTVAIERAPFVFTAVAIERAFALVESTANFNVDAASPVRAAPLIHVPVFLVHGSDDDATPPAHSQRVYDALRGPKQLVFVKGARHAGSLRGEVWPEIDAWIERQLFR